MFLANLTKVITTLLFLIMTSNNCKLLTASELHHHVYCNKEFLSVQLPLTSNHSKLFIKKVYWQNLHATALKGCQPLYHDHEITFRILFKNFFKCGFLSSSNEWQVSYNQDLIVQRTWNITDKINIKCFYKLQTDFPKLKHKLAKRSNLPEDFQEDADIEVLDTVEQKAPAPTVLIEVRQNNELIDGMVTVIPGTPLVMEIKLDDMANTVYGLNIKYLQVRDMAKMSETILYKGCTVDPYLFENFNFTTNNSLISKFRAFKFPNTAFVQFRANVQICLKKCMTPQCIGSSSSKETRKRREVKQEKYNFHEVHTSFVLNVNDSFQHNSAESQKLRRHVNLLHSKNLHLSNVA